MQENKRPSGAHRVRPDGQDWIRLMAAGSPRSRQTPQTRSRQKKPQRSKGQPTSPQTTPPDSRGHPLPRTYEASSEPLLPQVRAYEFSCDTPLEGIVHATNMAMMYPADRASNESKRSKPAGLTRRPGRPRSEPEIGSQCRKHKRSGSATGVILLISILKLPQGSYRSSLTIQPNPISCQTHQTNLHSPENT